MGEELENSEGDQCPNDDCEQTLHRFDHGSPEDHKPAAPVVELVCPVHKVVESA